MVAKEGWFHQHDGDTVLFYRDRGYYIFRDYYHAISLVISDQEGWPACPSDYAEAKGLILDKELLVW